MYTISKFIMAVFAVCSITHSAQHQEPVTSADQEMFSHLEHKFGPQFMQELAKRAQHEKEWQKKYQGNVEPAGSEQTKK